MEPEELRALVRRVGAEHGAARDRRGAVLATTSVGPYLGALVVGVVAAQRAAWPLAVLAVVVAAAFAVRMFCVMHECSHGSVFARRHLDEVLGAVLGALLLTPFGSWRRRHLVHHAALGDLDRRGWHDYPTLTVAEYAALSRPRRALYRTARHPLFILGVAPLLFLGVVQRAPAPGASRRERVEVVALDATIVAAVALLWRLGVLATFVRVQLPVFVLAGAAGYFLFHVQHQFPGGWWRHGDAWRRTDAAWLGSTHLRLPAPLEWLTCAIGYHHVHHLVPRVPGDRLPAAHRDLTALGDPPTIGLRDSRACFRVALWDERQQRLASFGELRAQTGTMS